MTGARDSLGDSQKEQVGDTEADGGAPGSVGSASGDDRPPFPVVAIGASAGGLEALRDLLRAIPGRPGLAFVVVQHLDPDHESLMADLLSRHTELTVVQIEDGMPVEPDHFYVIPPNRALTLQQGRLRLTEPDAPRGTRMPIDRFFASVASEARGRGIAIVLSGTGTDGTLGIREVKAQGGLVLVQEPRSAAYDGMPQSAIATGQADVVAPVRTLTEVLLRYVQHDYVLNGDDARASLADADDEDRDGADPLTRILAVLRSRTGHDFRGYKRGSVLRRVQRRMSLAQQQSLQEYLDYLRSTPEEPAALVWDLLISVTNFFREPEAWEALQSLVLDPLVQREKEIFPLRLWVPGCATGEEAYTLAFLLEEAFERHEREPDYVIFGTDLDPDALEVARSGIYPENVVADVGPQRADRFLRRRGSQRVVDKRVRESIVFAPHNLIADPVFSHLHLISCRNLLIYLEPDLQERILAGFHFALERGGILALGSSETVTRQSARFEPLSKKWRIYRRVGAGAHPTHAWPVSDRRRPHPVRAPTFDDAAAPDRTEVAARLLLERFVPASVLVGRDHRVQYYFGRTERFLSQPPGEPTGDLLTLVRRELRLKVRAALFQATQEARPATLLAGYLERDGQRCRVQVTVTPLPRPLDVDPGYLVTFQESGEPTYGHPEGQAGEPPEPPPLVGQLEEELRHTREELQATLEEMETSNEELKASNEEVMSMNEELQSSNEELETSREELQSLNEELLTVNNQLESKVQELEETTNDLENLLASTNIATLFLDRQLRIRRFTDAARRVFRLIPSDVGRSIDDIKARYDATALVLDARRVLSDLTPLEQTVRTDEGAWYLARTRPYRTHDDRIEGVVITYTDITEKQHVEDQVHALNQQLNHRLDESEALLELAPIGIFIAHDGTARDITANPAGLALLGMAEAPFDQNVAIPRGARLPFQMLQDGQEVPDAQLPITEACRKNRPVGPTEMTIRWEDGREIEVLAAARPLLTDDGEVKGAVGVMMDITDQKRTEQELRDSRRCLLEQTEALRQADLRRDHFLALIGHELRNPLAPIRYVAHLLGEQADDLSEPAARRVAILQRQSRQLARLVDELLDVSRIRRGRIVLQQEPTPLSRVVSTAVEAVAPSLAEGKYDLTVELPDLPLWIQADEARLVQVLQNLLVNAIQFSEPGSPIRVEARRAGNEATVSIVDRGVGIASARLKTIFDTFETPEDARCSALGGGLGLGLTLVKQLVELHGGRVEAQSAGLGEGSAFVVHLPRLEALDGTALPSEPVKAPRLPQVPEGRRVLVVDDQADLAQTLSELLEDMGVEVRTARDGAGALAAAPELQPHLVLLDIALPDRSGVEVARELRAMSLQPAPRIVALSGFHHQDTGDAESDSLFDEWLVKPIDLDELEQLLTT